MNPELGKLQPYPFERLAALFNGVTPPGSVRTIALHIGEPAHPAPQTVMDTLWAHRDGFSKYPKTAGEPWLRDAMAAWLRRRYGLSAQDLEASIGVLPVNGSREALFSFTQAVVSRASEQACVATACFISQHNSDSRRRRRRRAGQHPVRAHAPPGSGCHRPSP